jgi:hypothetical protein
MTDVMPLPGGAALPPDGARMVPWQHRPVRSRHSPKGIDMSQRGTGQADAPGLLGQPESRGRRGADLLFATHYLEEADQAADRILVINKGRLLADGTPAEIKKRAGAKRRWRRGSTR